MASQFKTTVHEGYTFGDFYEVSFCGNAVYGLVYFHCESCGHAAWRKTLGRLEGAQWQINIFHNDRRARAADLSFDGWNIVGHDAHMAFCSGCHLLQVEEENNEMADDGVLAIRLKSL